IDLDPKDAEAYLSRGLVKIQLKHDAASICQDLRKAKESGNSNAQNYIAIHCK
ncbi:MAG: hypothetical protein JWO03_1669, partial [Bacteroidetes bacterium]|nr:hypothetical protein [Bacteroidota bacterium]